MSIIHYFSMAESNLAQVCTETNNCQTKATMQIVADLVKNAF